MNELDIIAMIKQSALKLSADEIIAEYKGKGICRICQKLPPLIAILKNNLH